MPQQKHYGKLVKRFLHYVYNKVYGSIKIMTSTKLKSISLELLTLQKIKNIKKIGKDFWIIKSFALKFHMFSL